MKKMLLIDGNSLMFRAYYATAYTGQLMKNTNGLYTNAIYGFCNMVNSVISDMDENSYVFVAFDAGKQTFRHKEYDEYKAGRKPMPEEFRVQIPYIKKFLDALNIMHCEMLEYEADDLLATVAEMGKKQGVDEITVVTGDKDLLQLVDKGVSVSLTKKGITNLDKYTISNFKEKMGFMPAQITDYKGLVGDSSDNLPGIKGIGDKTAQKLLAKYETLENIVSHSDSLTGRSKELVKKGSAVGLKCKEMATLVRDIKVDFTISDLKYMTPDYDKLSEIYEELEFKSFLNRMKSKPQKQNLEHIKFSYRIATIDDDFSVYSDIIVIPEIFGTNYYKAKLLGLAFVSGETNLFIPTDVLVGNKSLQALLNSDITISTFDYKLLCVVLSNYGITISKPQNDLLLAAYLINPTYADDDFKKVSDCFRNYDLLYNNLVYGTGTKMMIPESNMYQSNGIYKCLIIRELNDEINKKLNDEKLFNLYKMEIDLSNVLSHMEQSGLYIDVAELHKVGKDLETEQEKYQKLVYSLSGEEFNINSVKQLGEVLFEKLAIPSGKKNKSGFSTSAPVLNKLAEKYEIVKYVLQYRKFSKLINTYVNGMEMLIDKGHYIHPLYRQALTVTGRLSSIEPNIQNMPIRSEEGQIIRDIFRSRFEGGQIMSIDYSQIELRVLAHMSNDKAMIESFETGEDFHRATAAMMFSVPVNEVTSNMRRTAKAINFGIIYGMGAWSLSKSIDATPAAAQEYIDKYFSLHSGIDKYLKNCIKDAKTNGYTKTLYNRVRYIPELSSTNKNIVSFGERTAMNSPIQGTAADILKMAMVEVFNKMKKANLKSLIIAQVHDELVFDCAPGEQKALEKLAQDAMEHIVTLKVPLLAKVSVGESWLKA